MAKNATQTQSKKDAFRQRFAGKYPDVDMEDEDAYYDQANNMFDEYESMSENSATLRDRMAENPELAEMLVAATQTKDFDPIIWLAENKGLDLEAIVNGDEEYLKKVGEAREKNFQKRAKADEIEKAMKKNMPASIEKVRAKGQELGMSDEQIQDTIKKMYQTMDDLIQGKMDVQIFELLAKGSTYDEDVETARDEGMAEGLNTKVNDKLRTLKGKERNGGAQLPMEDMQPQRQKNMFEA